MQAEISQFILLCLVLNVVLTLGSVGFSYVSSKRSQIYKNKFSEDLINLKISVINALVEVSKKVFGLSFLALFLYPISQILPHNFEWSLANLALCFILTDLLYYFSHLAGHRIQLFWNQHCVHHSSESFSLSTGYRKSWLAFAVNWVFYIPLGLAGFPPQMILMCLVLITAYTHLLHTENILSVPYMEYIFNTPKAHRIHHSSHELHIDKNMAGVFMFWDHIFKTFSLTAPDKVIYGLTKPVKKNDIVSLNFQEWFWIKKIILNRGYLRALKVLLQSPDKNQALRTDTL